VPQVEYGHLDKFVISIGLVLIGSAAAIHWAVLRETGPLTVTTDELAELTDVARAVLLERQDQLATITHWYQPFCVLLVLIGLACVVVGLLRWRPQQARADRLAQAEAEKRFRELEEASAEVRERKTRHEAARAQAQERPTARDLRARQAYPPASAHLGAAEGGAPASARPEGGAALVAAYREVESELARALKAALQPEFLVREHVLVPGPDGSARVGIADLVAVSTSVQHPDLVVELRYAPSRTSLPRVRHEAAGAADRLARLLARSQPDRPTQPVAVVVQDGEPGREPIADPEAADRIEDDVPVLVIGRRELADLVADPDALRGRLRRQL
jgi:hypothetical protein